MIPRRIAVAAGTGALVVATVAPASAQPTIEVIGEGLEAPRGLLMAGDGSLIVAEAGTAGDACPMGEAGFCFGPTGAIARVIDGDVQRIAEGLPSAGSGPEIVGPSDVAVGSDGELYAVINWGGDPGEREEGDLGGWIVRIPGDGSFEAVADVAIFEATDDPDAEFSGGVLDTNPHSLVAEGDGFVVADAGANALLDVDGSGAVSEIAVVPPEIHEFPGEMMAALGPPPDGEMAPEGDAMAEGDEMAAGEDMAEAMPDVVPVPVESVPTAVVVGPDGAYYVAELTGGPFPVGGARVLRIEPGGQPETYATGLSAVMDIDFGPDGTLYAAEIVHEGLMDVFMGAGVPIGAVMAVAPGGGEAELLATGEELMALGGIHVGDDGLIYATANTMTPGGGTVVRITP